MSLARTKHMKLTTEEWNEMNALRKAINHHLQSVSSHQMEKFTELLVRSLEGKSDLPQDIISPFEKYCQQNPSASACRIYDL